MKTPKAKRFGARLVTSGKHKGMIHIAPSKYTEFHGALQSLEFLLSERNSFLEPEEITIRNIFLELAIIFEDDLTKCLKRYYQRNRGLTEKDRKRQKELDRGNISFGNMIRFCKEYKIINENEYQVLCELKNIRNFYAHERQTLNNRKRIKYKNRSLIRSETMVSVLSDCNQTHKKLNNDNKFEFSDALKFFRSN